MNSSTETGQRNDLLDYLAAERTLLAWIHTGLALIPDGTICGWSGSSIAGRGHILGLRFRLSRLLFFWHWSF
jgi:hypothetical protein